MNGVSAGCLAFLISFLMLISAVAPVVYWGDDGSLIVSSMNFGLSHPPGHPVYIHSYHIFSYMPIGDFANRFNIASSIWIASAAAVGGVWVFLQAKKHFSGMLATATMSFLFCSLPFVRHQACRAETYGLNIFLIALAWIFLASGAKSKQILLGCLFIGLSLANQLLLSIMALPALMLQIAINLRKQKVLTQFAKLAVFIALGLSAYIYAPLRSTIAPDSFHSTIKTGGDLLDYLTAKDYQVQFYGGDSNIFHNVWKGACKFHEHFSQSLGWPLYVFAIISFLWNASRRPSQCFGLMVLAGLNLIGVFSIESFDVRNWDFQGYLLSALFSLSISIGLCAMDIAEIITPHIKCASFLILLPAALAPALLQEAINLKNHTFARDLGKIFLNDTPDNAVILTRSDLAYILRYLLEIEHYRDNHKIISRNSLIRDQNLLETFRRSGIITEGLQTPGNDQNLVTTATRLLSQMYPVVWESADDDRAIRNLNPACNSLFFMLGRGFNDLKSDDAFLDYFRKTGYGAGFRGDQNAIEQISMFFYNRGCRELNCEQFSAAHRDLAFSVALNPSESKFRNNFGVALVGMNQINSARIQFRMVLELDVNHQGARRNLNLLDGKEQ